MYTRPVKHIMGAIALFAAFAAWGRSISIESVNRNASGDIESITLGFTADEQPLVQVERHRQVFPPERRIHIHAHRQMARLRRS